MIIDFHAHILPGLDHGSTGLNMTLLQLMRAKKAGVDCIVATSHFNPYAGTIDDFLIRRQNSWNMLGKALEPDMPRIVLGAEVLLCANIDKMEGFLCLAAGGNKAVLVEMPGGPWSRELLYTVEKVNALCCGQMVIAHVERYERKSVEYLFEMGTRGQINVTALCRMLRRGYLMKWIEQGNIAALGSDIHREEKTYRQFARMKALLGEHFETLMHTSEQLLFPTHHQVRETE